MDTIQICETDKGKPSLIFQNYRYRIDRSCRSGTGDILWRCTFTNCKARLRTNNAMNQVLQLRNPKEHCHPPNERAIAQQILRTNIKRKAVEDIHSRPSKILQSELQGMSGSVTFEARDIKNAAMALYRERRKAMLPPSPTAAAVAVNRILKRTRGKPRRASGILSF